MTNLPLSSEDYGLGEVRTLLISSIQIVPSIGLLLKLTATIVNSSILLGSFLPSLVKQGGLSDRLIFTSFQSSKSVLRSYCHREIFQSSYALISITAILSAVPLTRKTNSSVPDQFWKGGLSAINLISCPCVCLLQRGCRVRSRQSGTSHTRARWCCRAGEHRELARRWYASGPAHLR